MSSVSNDLDPFGPKPEGLKAYTACFVEAAEEFK
jgi:hypothetical protein